MTAPSDHPPAIPPIGVRQHPLADIPVDWLMAHAPEDIAAREIARRLREIFDTVPLGLSPEQPARCGGTES